MLKLIFSMGRGLNNVPQLPKQGLPGKEWSFVKLIIMCSKEIFLLLLYWVCESGHICMFSRYIYVCKKSFPDWKIEIFIKWYCSMIIKSSDFGPRLGFALKHMWPYETENKIVVAAYQLVLENKYWIYIKQLEDCMVNI